MKCKEIADLDEDSPYHKHIWSGLPPVIGTVEGMEIPFTTVRLKAKCCHALLRDDTGGIIPLTLWDEDVDIVKNGDRIEITNGYRQNFKGKKRFSAGTWGVLRVLSKGQVVVSPIQVRSGKR